MKYDPFVCRVSYDPPYTLMRTLISISMHLYFQSEVPLPVWKINAASDATTTYVYVQESYRNSRDFTNSVNSCMLHTLSV